MNSKKKLTALGFMLFFILLQQISFAQTFQFTPTTSNSPGKFRINLASINPKQAPPKAYYRLFIETGNGRYFKTKQINDAYLIPAIDSVYNYKIDSGSNAILTISSYYDTTPRPPRGLYIAVGNPGGEQLQNQTNLPTSSFLLNPASSNPASQRIAIDPCVETVVPGDTMAVAITYKPYISNANQHNLIAFFYNKPDEGGDIFNVIDSDTKYNYTYNSKATQKINAIRTHNDEKVFTSYEAILGELPSDVIEIIKRNNNGYSNVLFFKVPNNADETEKNIFLSLAPTKNSLSYNKVSSTCFAATILQYNGIGLIGQNQQTIFDSLGIDLVARDPNGIAIYPYCLQNKSYPKPYNRDIHSLIEFQNDGAGDAVNVENIIHIPDGIDFPVVLNNVYIYANGTQKIFEPFRAGVLNSNYYKLDKVQRQITFVMNGINLPGTLLPENRNNVNRRQGRIEFWLKTNPENTNIPPNQINNSIPSCMYFDLSIIFVTRSKLGSLTRNKAIKASNLLRRVCGSSDPCSRYSTPTNTN